MTATVASTVGSGSGSGGGSGGTGPLMARRQGADVSAHARYRAALTALGGPDALTAVLDGWSAAHGVTPPARWSREYGRFHPGGQTWAVLAYTAPVLQCCVQGAR